MAVKWNASDAFDKIIITTNLSSVVIFRSVHRVHRLTFANEIGYTGMHIVILDI